MNTKIDLKNVWLYIICIPFLYPRGFGEFFNGYLVFFKTWMYCSILLIILSITYNVLINRIKVNRAIIYMEIYFIYAIGVTIIQLGKIGEGLQKLFAVPVFCTFCMFYIKKDCKRFVYILSNIFMTIYFLGCTVFSPIIFRMITGQSDQHIIFLGHVQMMSQMGILSIFLAILLWKYNSKIKARWLFILTILNMLISQTAASYICITIILVAYISRKILYNTVSHLKIRFSSIFIIMLVLNIIIVFCVVYFKINFGARYFIYVDAIEQVLQRPLLGYGVYGTNIHVFWSAWTNNGIGFNYAHNDLLQQLLDGGCIKLIIYTIMIYKMINNSENKNSVRIKTWEYIILICLFLISVCESVSEYVYFFIIIMLINNIHDMNMCRRDKDECYR